MDDEERSSAAVLQSMTLLATLSTALDVRDGVEARRSGHDPSAQESPSVARAHLQTSAETLMDLQMQLMLGSVHLRHQDEDAMAAVVRHFDLLMKLRRSERRVHGMHQRLLSLYPDVSDALVEDAREVHGALARLVDADDVEAVASNLRDVVERTISFVVWTQHEVG